MEHENENPSRHSGTRRTRSQASPDWPANHLLILVNEIAAIEVDCSNALSSFQKWKIIVENCNALGVPYSSNQCRKKWSLLLHDYNKIKRWESQSVVSDSYWSLGVQKRKEYELPENFEEDLFKAINDVVGLQGDKSGTDRDSDPEAQDGTLDIITDLGPKKHRRKLVPLRNHAEAKAAKSHKRCTMERSKKLHIIEKPQKSCNEEKLQRNEAVKRSRSETEVKQNSDSEEEEEHIMVARLGENAEKIHTLVNENLGEIADDRATDLNFVRHQADQLIACLGDTLSTLNQFLSGNVTD